MTMAGSSSSSSSNNKKQRNNTVVSIATAISVAIVSAVVVAWFQKQRRARLLYSDPAYADKQRHEQRRLRELQEAVKDSPNGAAFIDAAQRIRTTIPASKLSSGERLILYGLYKQATHGDVPAVQFRLPSLDAVLEHAKRNAWYGMRGMSSEEAIMRYIAAVQDVEQRLSQGLVDTSDDDDGAMLEGFAHNHVSRPAVDNGGIEIQEDETGNNKNGSSSASTTRIVSPENALLAAAGANDVETIRRLLKQRDANGNALVSVDYQDASGQSALHLASDKNATAAVAALLEIGANANAVDHDGISVLQAAVIAGHVAVCRILLEKGHANPDLADADGDTPRSCAADDGSEQMLQLFSMSSL